MVGARRSLSVGFCNACTGKLAVWLEPWAEEFILPPRAELVLEVESETGDPEPPEMETNEGGVAIYAAGGSLVRVFIDGLRQRSASNSIAVPGMGVLSTTGFVDTVFGSFPEARPGGKPAPPKRAWYRRLLGND